MFGAELRERSFSFDVINLNHGSYGACPREVADARIEGITTELTFPDKYYRYDLHDVIKRARSVFAEELNCDLEDVVCVPNATYGMNLVLRSFAKRGYEHVVYFSAIYSSCLMTIRDIQREWKFTDHEIRIPLDIPDAQDLVHLLKAKLQSMHLASTVVLFETVSSMPAITFPFADLVALCHEMGVPCVIDGAHGIGLVHIDLKQLQPDAFVTNAHKWYYSAHSVAALYVKRENHPWTRNIISGWMTQDKVDQGLFAWADTFEWAGTSDQSAVYAIEAAQKFRNEVLGGNKVAIAYQNQLSEQAAHYLTSEWGVREIASFGPEYRTALFTIECPYQPAKDRAEAFIAFAMKRICDYGTFIPLALYNGKVLMRFSAAVYLELDDFKFGKRAFESTIKSWEESESNNKIE